MNVRPSFSIRIAAAVLALQPTVSSLAAAAPGVKPAPESGLNIVLDASESMCGYFSQEDANRTIQSIVGKAVGFTDRAAGDRFYLLKQASKKTIDPTSDLVEARSTIKADAQHISHVPNRQGAGCSPFNGVGSDIASIFEPKSPVRSAHSLVLVTDAQLSGDERERFVEGFTNWALAGKQAGESLRAGFAYAEVPFEGRYFPVSDPESKRREAGYSIGKHERPLFIFWFAHSDKRLKEIKEFVDTIATPELQKRGKAGIQHLLPILATGNEPFVRNWTPTPDLGKLLDSSATLTFPDGTKRNKAMLAQCLKVLINPRDITVQASKPCPDDKQLFDGVASADLHVKMRANDQLKTEIARTGEGGGGDVLWKLTPKTIARASSFQLNTVLREGGSSVLSLRDQSMDSDFCKGLGATAGKEAAIEACLARLQGRTFQVDLLAEQLLNRQKRVTGDLLAPLNAMAYPLLFTWKAR